MVWPVIFGTQSSPEPMANLDTMFNAAAALTSIPCTASGTNAISLTPLANAPALTNYNDLGGYRAVAVATTTGPVTAQYNGLGFLPVYHADGVTQANVSDIIINQQYIFTFHQALNGGAGGFYFESPSQPLSTSSWNQPGGRLTFQSATPVMFTNQLAQQTIFYAPYQHPFVPIYNGSTLQMYQFTSSLSDQVGLSLSMGGGAQWTNNNNFDLFATLIAGVPTLVGVPWTNNTTRATTLSVFGGLLTNSGACTAFTGAATSVTMPINQGMFLGTVHTSAAGQSQWQFGGSASGGTAAFHNLCNYYNPVLFATNVTDSGTSYTYSSSSNRQARASTGNQINFLQCSSERGIIVTYSSRTSLVAVGADTTGGVGFNSTTTTLPQNLVNRNSSSSGQDMTISGQWELSFTGYGFLAAVEGGDGGNANNFDVNLSNTLGALIWL